MISVHKYILKVKNNLSLPEGYKILSVAEQRGDVCLWVQLDTDKIKSCDRTIEVFGTGHNIPKHEINFIGTVLQHGGDLVLHVFDTTPPTEDKT